MKEVTLSKIIGKTGVFIDGDWVESKDQEPNGDVRLIQLADIGDGVFINKSNRFLTSAKAKELKCTFLKKGDLLIARMPDPLGRSCIFPGINMPCVTVVDICIVRPDVNIAYSEWLKFLINSYDFRNKINKYITGTTRQRISRGNLEKLSFVLPPLSDQLHIANLLSKAENLISQRKQSIALLDEFLKSTFLEMFGDPVRNEKGWNIDLMSRVITDIISGTSYGGEEKKELDKNELGVLKISAVTSGAFNHKEFKAVGKNLILKKIVTCEKGMFLFSRANTRELVAACCIIPKDYPLLFIPDKLWSLYVDAGKANNVYLNHLFKNESYRNTMREKASGGHDSMLNISMQKFRNLRLPIPLLDLQTQFAQIVEKTEALKVQYQSSLQELENLYGSLSQRAFPGELTRNQAEEKVLMAVGPEINFQQS